MADNNSNNEQEPSAQLAELYKKDFQLFQNPISPTHPRFYHLQQEIPTEPIPTNLDDEKVINNLVGVYDLIYTTGYSESFELNRAIQGQLILYKTPQPIRALPEYRQEGATTRLWGEIRYHCTQPDGNINLFERNFRFAQVPATTENNVDNTTLGGYLYEAYDDALDYIGQDMDEEGTTGWIQSKDWSLRKVSQDFSDCTWHPEEEESRTPTFLSERTEALRRQTTAYIDVLTQLFGEAAIARQIYSFSNNIPLHLDFQKGDLLLEVQWSAPATIFGGGDDWTSTIARRNPNLTVEQFGYCQTVTDFNPSPLAFTRPLPPMNNENDDESDDENDDPHVEHDEEDKDDNDNEDDNFERFKKRQRLMFRLAT